MPTYSNRTVILAALGTAVLALTGCQLPWASPPKGDVAVVQPDELSEAGGRPCPKRLPVAEDPSGHGFGIEEEAERAPTFRDAHKAWTCRYDPVDGETTPDGGTTLEWKRAGKPQPVADLDGLRSALDELVPADPERMCTMDLSSRWMVVLSHDGDLTGVVVDDYGCREVRLTDDPHATPPGADGQDGVVGGVLTGGETVLEGLGVGRSR